MEKERLSILIKKTALAVEKKTNQALSEIKLTNAQLRILLMLYHKQHREIRQIDIETAFGMTNPTVTGILNNLEKKDLIMRRENPKDKRSKIISLTSHAFSIIPEIFDYADEIEEQVVKSLTKKEQEQLGAILKKIMKNID